jgi:hypothetical protein
VRLAAVGAEPVAWAERDVLTIAVRQSRNAPSVVGTVSGSNARLTALQANGLKELLRQREAVQPAARQPVTSKKEVITTHISTTTAAVGTQ